MDERTRGAAVFLAGLVLFLVVVMVVLMLVFGTGRTL
jgi:hypothetical protein